MRLNGLSMEKNLSTQRSHTAFRRKVKRRTRTHVQPRLKFALVFLASQGLEYYEPGQWVSCHCKVVKPFKRAPLTNAGNKQIDQQAIKSYSNLPTFFHEISFVITVSCISQPVEFNHDTSVSCVSKLRNSM